MILKYDIQKKREREKKKKIESFNRRKLKIKAFTLLQNKNN